MKDVQQEVPQQKVYITLTAYTELVREYARVSNEVAKNGTDHTQMLARKRTLEYVFRTLNLPVSV